MSFLNSLQEYVSNSVAGLSLGTKSRSESGNGDESMSPRGSTDAGPPAGFPRVLPSPGIEALPQTAAVRRRSTLEALPNSSIPTRRPGSFRRNQPTPQPPEPPKPNFCVRRASWPDIDVQMISGVHDYDGSYFENINGVSWEQESRRETARRDFKTSFREAQPQMTGPSLDGTPDDFLSGKERDQLYIEMLCTIANAVGAPTDSNYKEILYFYGQEAFNISSDHHYRLLHAVGEGKQPIVVLNVVVVEAEGLEAKDANGFSDPYCMLGIKPLLNSPLQSSPSIAANRTLSESGVSLEPNSPRGQGNYQHPELRKHHSFRLSFKRRDSFVPPEMAPTPLSNSRSSISSLSGSTSSGLYSSGGGRAQRDSFGGGQLPAKFIRATSVKPHTLNPRWNEKFRFDIDDVNSDSLHLDIWDHDDESSVLEAVSKLNEVRGVRGLGRFFKQVCQSARQSSQDDFLGCITVSLSEIPCTGLDGWFKLEARSHRSTVQGRIHLKMWLSTREEHGGPDDDNWEEMLVHEQLHRLFLRHEILINNRCELSEPAATILRQHAAQADLSDLQRASAALAAHVNVLSTYASILVALRDLHKAWINAQPVDPPFNMEQQSWLAETFTKLIERSLLQVRNHRQLFCGTQAPQLESLLRCLSTLASLPAYGKCCPFNKEIRSEIVGALRKGTIEWFTGLKTATRLSGEPERSLVCLLTALYVELEAGFEIYHPLFESINGINYFSLIYKLTDKLLTEETLNYLNEFESCDAPGGRWALLEPELSAITSTLALYLELKDFVNLPSQLGQSAAVVDTHKQLQIAVHLHDWFEPAAIRWLAAIRPRAMQRVRNAWRIATTVNPSTENKCVDNRLVYHSTTCIDVARLVGSMRDLWTALGWPAHAPNTTSLLFIIVDIVACCSNLHCEMAKQKLEQTGYYARTQGPFQVVDDMCVVINDMEYVGQCIYNLEQNIDYRVYEACETGRASIERAKQTIQTRIDEILNKCGQQMHDQLRKVSFHLAWSPDSLPTQQAISPMLEYLHDHLLALNKTLLPKNFQRVLYHVWEAVLLALSEQADAGGAATTDTPENFWKRLSDALNLLGRWWMGVSVDTSTAKSDSCEGTSRETATDNSMEPVEIRTQSYLRLEQRLRYHRTETETLIELFHCERLLDQMSAQQQVAITGTPFGTLTVRAYFNHDSLCVEVLHARDIIPLDPNGFSDPFVIVELLPKRLFSHCAEQQTHVHKKTLNPMFDECFEFSVTLEACRDPASMLLFTVMDHDVLTANDFAGEAFLALNSIPGVANITSSVDNFHGLKEMELVLMQQYDRHHPIIQILETRLIDKTAADFVKRQKLRLASNVKSAAKTS